MSLNAVYGGKNVSLHIDFQKTACERHIHTAFLRIVCNSLDMLGLATHKDSTRKCSDIGTGKG